MTAIFKTRTTCRVCLSPLDPILSLGNLHISNFLMSDSKDGTRVPLEIALCSRCGLLQLKHTANPENLYRNYWYRSGTNKTMTDALCDIANKSERLMRLEKGDTVLDIGCNDGTLLASYRTQGIYKVGFDPAENLVPISRKAADKIVPDFFTSESYLKEAELKLRKPKIITSIAMFYDLEEPKAFVADIKKIMHQEGLWVVQMSYLPLMLQQNAFDNICHEHLGYYSLVSFEYLLRLYDFEVVDVEVNDVNGGSLRAYIRNLSARKELFGDPDIRKMASSRMRRLRDDETNLGLNRLEIYKGFINRVQDIKNAVSGFIKEQVRLGKIVYIYGASTKGCTLLQYFGLDNSLITAAAER
ncbi:MAG: class I SAM-dependent methyltransferase, partial [Candidatus Omnitrophica bacterium]|nr:class I SAM-dependent methyltransferase [Candidatus Omnitrophota bacterium]